MYHPPIKSSSKPVKSRLGWKIAGLFAGTFLAVVIGLFFWDLLKTLGDKTIVDAASSGQSPVAVIDPKLETDLAKVLELNDSQTTADIKNPFADTTGISAQSNQPAGSTVSTSSPTATTAAKTNGTQTVPQRTQLQQTQTVTGKTAQPNQPAVTQSPQEATRARLQLREDRLRLGMDAGPESSVYAIDDLLPVGVVSGGDGKDEVMFYSETACRVVSFPVGTQFYDGWIDSLRQEGVVFGFFDQYRTKRMRAWGRSVTQGCTQSILEQTSPNQAPTTTGGGD